MDRRDIRLGLADELGKIAADRLELLSARCLNDLPSMIVDTNRWDNESLEALLRKASERIPNREPSSQGKAMNRRKAARLALGVEPRRDKSPRDAVIEMGYSERESQPSRRDAVERLWPDLAVALMDLSYEVLRPSGPVEVLADEGDVTASLIHYIKENHPKELRFLELSAASVSQVLVSAINSPDVREIRLLVADPRMLSPYHWEKRLLQTLDTLRLAVEKHPATFRGPPSITIRCYGFRHFPDGDASATIPVPDVMPSLRGRNLGDGLISLGWYTYAPRLQATQAAKSLETPAYPVKEVWGHDVPIIMAQPDDAGFTTLRTFFNQQFEALWNGCKDRNIPPAARLGDAIKDRDEAAYEERSAFLAQVSPAQQE
ncbi:MAG: hypothetical protein WD404_05145 [Solirubrobacterales bacterium]